MNIILPIQYPCIVDCFSGVADNVSIYMNYPESYMPLLIANHFLISYSKRLGHVGYNWKYYNDDYGHFIDCRKEVQDLGVINAIIKYISSGNYIKLILDFYYINNSPWYKKEKNTLHWIPMIIGFDDEKKIVYLCDNLINGKFQIIEVPFWEIENARLGHENDIFDCCYYDKEINYELTLDYIKLLIKSYLDSDCYIEKKFHPSFNDTEHGEEMDEKELCGIIMYDIMLKQAEDSLNNFEKHDVRTFHIMVEHNRICCKLVEWLYKSNYIKKNKYNELSNIKKQYEELLIYSNIIENLYIKLCITFNIDLFHKIKIKLFEMKDKEIRTLKELLTILNNE